MRNLKKLLALVLAMVMTFSLMLTASAVDYEDYPDKDSITAEFDEAVQVLTGLEVMQGDEKGFRPSDKITRAEAAAIIYRVATGDVTDRQTDLYKDYSTFTDVKHDDWFAGYVGYCQNAGYIKGTSPTTFSPYGQVTGYEVLAMILRAVGYGKNNEFTGASWQVNVAALSKQLGVTKDVVAAHMDQTLNMAAPREVVADLVFMTMATVPMVTYTPALAYNDKQSVVSEIYNPTLGQQIFGLFHDTTWQTIDEWGRPGYYWYQDGVWPGSTWVTTANTGKGYVIPANHPFYTVPTNVANADAWLAEHTIATIGYAPSYETKEQVLECDVAEALDIATQDTFRLFVNGPMFDNDGDFNGDTTVLANGNPCDMGAVANNYRIVATDTVTKVGGQGRITEFYYDLDSAWFVDKTGYADRAVMIDTMLTQITAKRDAKLDPAGHVITPAQLEVTIWDGTNTNGSSSRVISKGRTDATNWEEYSRGDYILIHDYTNKTARVTAEQREQAAFQTDKVVGTAGSTLTINSRAWIVDNGNDGKAENFQAKQTTVYYNQGKHQVDGQDYLDQIELYLNRAGTTTNTTFTWYLDQFGNLIGIGDAHAVRYGVITSIYAAFGQGESDTTGAVKAIANVKYADGTTGTETISKFRVSWGTKLGAATGSVTSEATAKVPATATYPTGLRTEPGTTLGIGTAANTLLTAPVIDDTATPNINSDTLELRPVYDTVTHPALSISPITINYSFSNVANAAWLYLAPSTSTNSNAHFASDQTDAFGILYNNMYRFSVDNDNEVIATEVSGSYGTSTGTSTVGYTNSNGLFSNMANAIASTAAGTLYKTLSYMTFQTVALTSATGTAAGQQLVYVDNDTRIMVRLSGTNTINCYDGVDALPGDVTLPVGTEIDWTDTDNDGRADFVYINAGSIPSTVSYGLFYYNGTGAQWNGSDGTINGYLNGEQTNLTFNDRTAFNTVNNSLSTTVNYLGHLFAVRMENGAVTDVLSAAYANSATTYQTTPYILRDANTAIVGSTAAYTTRDWSGMGLTGTADNFNNVIGTATAKGNDGTATTLNTSAAGTDALTNPMFATGMVNGGNNYTTNTRAVYYRDKISDAVAVAGDTVLRYVRESGGHKIMAYQNDGTTLIAEYWLAPNCVIVGELDWLNTNENDVTMVYEEGVARSVTQLYIARDPDITPSGYTVVIGAGVTDLSSATYANEAAFAAALKALPAGTVSFNSAKKASAGWPGSKADEILYFSFANEGAAAAPASLTIRNAAGTAVYFESAASAPVGGNFFSVNFTNASTANDGNWLISPRGLVAGSYTFAIAVNGVTTVTGGFSMK